MTQNPAVEVAGPSRRHVPALDGVRGMAIVLVLVSHLMLFNDHTGSRFGDSLSALRGLGWVGVDLFFVLSGFLITGILFDTLQDPHYFGSFYMRRFLRIFPLYYGFLFFLMILGHWSPGMHFAWNGRQYVLLTYLQNTGIWFPVTDFHPGIWADLDHFWSLAVEEQFYLFWPLLVFLVRGRRRLIALALALSGFALLLRIALYLHGSSPLLIFMLTPCRMDTLLLGGLVALVVRGDSDWIPRRWMMPVALVAGVVIAAYTLSHLGRDMRDFFFGATFGYSVIALGCVALLIASLEPESVAHHIFRWSWLRSLGKYSYGIYVTAYFCCPWSGDTHQPPAGYEPAYLVDTTPAFPPPGGAAGVLFHCGSSFFSRLSELSPVRSSFSAAETIFWLQKKQPANGNHEAACIRLSRFRDRAAVVSQIYFAMDMSVRRLQVHLQP